MSIQNIFNRKKSICVKMSIILDNLQVNKCETVPYFLQNFQFATMSIPVFCKSCEPICEPEIVLKKFQLTFRLTPLTSAAKSLSHSMFSSQMLPYAKINIVVHRKFWRKYGPVSNLFSCTTKGYGYEKSEFQILKETFNHRDYLANLNMCCLRLKKLKLFNSHAKGHQYFVAIDVGM